MSTVIDLQAPHPSSNPCDNPCDVLPALPELDSDGHLIDHLAWTPERAQLMADTLGITLTELHLRILYATRAFFFEYHHSPMTRPLIKYLKQELPDAGLDNAHLQQLFNTGLVARHVNRLAGLPKPPNCL